MGLFKYIAKNIFNAFFDFDSIKGQIGEIQVDSALNPYLFGKVKHRQINNLTIVDSNGQSHQIDHIEIRENGIFCIETKNYSGLIFGNEDQRKWTQCLRRGERNYFYSPIKQNNTHIYHLKKILGNKYNINSVIVFTQNNADNINIRNVINLCDLKNYLYQFNDGSNYTDDDMNYTYNKLISNNKNISKEEHISNIKNTNYKINNDICPRCNGKLVLRKGKYGEFYGCSNYPRCRFTIKK